MPNRGCTLASAVLGSALLLCSTARGDDWHQFRKDGGRTGASRDPLAFPLTDVWSWSSRSYREASPLHYVAVANGRAYFLSFEGNAAHLNCANAKTGSVLWRQRLNQNLTPIGPSPWRGLPAVTASGKVVVYDARSNQPALPGPPLRNRAGRRPQNRGELEGFDIKVYDGITGVPLASFPIDLLTHVPTFPEVALVHQTARSDRSGHWLRGSRVVAQSIWPSAPLINGDEVIATGRADGIVFRWAPGNEPSFFRVVHPLPGPVPELVGTSLNWAYPPVAAGGGLFVGDDQAFRYAAVVGGDTFHRWHQDVNTSLGLAACDGSSIFVGQGGIGATRALTCLDSETGAVRWTYAPLGLPFERQEVREGRIVHRHVNVEVLSDILKQGREVFREEVAKLVKAGRFPIESYEEVRVRNLQSGIPPGHLTSAGVVAAQNRVYGVVGGSVVALDQATGAPRWTQALPPSAKVSSLAASPKHLLACYSLPRQSSPLSRLGSSSARVPSFLAAFNLVSGKLEWEQPVTAPGQLALSEGLVYFANGDLTVMGPAERTYLIASDTDDPNHYTRPRPPKRPEDPNAPSIPVIVEPDPEGKPAEPSVPPHPAVRADASMLRLSFASTDRELVEKVQARTKLLAPKGAPLALQLDWLNAERSTVAGAPGGVWSSAAEARFIKLCAVLAAEAGPAYFDLAPDVNVYLRRYPERADALFQLLQRAARAVREGADGCQVIVSLNAETLLGAYGKGLVSPFGKLPLPDRKTEGERLNRLVNLVDALGLNVQPQAGYRNADVIPLDYLLRVRALVPAKPLLITQIKIEADAPGLVARADQARYVHRILPCCYWLNARWVMQPELVGYKEEPLPAEPQAGGVNLPAEEQPTILERVTKGPQSPVDSKPPAVAQPITEAKPSTAGVLDPIRLAAHKWRRVVHWERVERLTARPPLPDLTGGEEIPPAPAPAETR